MLVSRTTFLLTALASVSLASAQSYVGKVSVDVLRKGARLPIYRVPKLQKGDVLQVQAPFENKRASWSMIFLFTEPASQVTDADIKEIDLQRRGEGGKFNWQLTHEFIVPSDTATPLILFFPKGDGNPSGNIHSYLKKSVNDLKALTQAVEVEATRKDNLETFLKAVDCTPASASDDDKSKLVQFAGDLQLPIAADDLESGTGRIRAGLSVFRQAHESGRMPSPDEFGKALAGALPKAQSEYLKIFGDVVSIFASFTRKGTPVKTSFLPTVPTPVEDDVSLASTEPVNYSREKRSVLVYSPMPNQAESAPVAIKPTVPTVYVSQGPCELPVEAPAFLYTKPYGGDWSLKVRSGPASSVPLTLVPGRGFSFDASLLASAFKEAEAVEVAITGRWGFDNACAEVPFRIVRSAPLAWTISQTDAWKLVAKSTPEVELASADLNDVRRGSVQGVLFEDASGKTSPGTLLTSTGGTVRARFDLANAALGKGNILIQRAGLGQPDAIRGVTLYPPVPEGLAVTGFVGDAGLTLSGAGTGQVASVRVGGVEFAPTDPAPSDPNIGSLPFAGANGLPEIAPGQRATATLKDGRIDVPVGLRLLPRRPLVEGSLRVNSLVRTDGPAFAMMPGAISSRDSVEITIVSKGGRPFPAGTEVEFRPKAPGAPTTLTLDEQSPDLVFAPGRASLKANVKLALVAKSVGGQFEYRVVGEYGGASDWAPARVENQPVSIVRLPTFRAPTVDATGFRLVGSGLIFVEKVFQAGDSGPGAEIAFVKSSVPDSNGATAEQLVLPAPTTNAVYVKLLDFETPMKLSWNSPPSVAALLWLFR